MTVNITKRVEIAGKGWRFCPVVWAGNNRIKPDVVKVQGKAETHPEGAYYLDWKEGGRRIRIAGGKTAAEAQAKAEQQEKLNAAYKANKAAGIVLPAANDQQPNGRLLTDAVA